jgi:hypothetical protein
MTNHDLFLICDCVAEAQAILKRLEVIQGTGRDKSEPAGSRSRYDDPSVALGTHVTMFWGVLATQRPRLTLAPASARRGHRDPSTCSRFRRLHFSARAPSPPAQSAPRALPP